MCIRVWIGRRSFLQPTLFLLTVLVTSTALAWPGNGGGKGGGGNPPAELIPVKVILMAGQSNMAGRGLNGDLVDLAPGLVQPQEDVQIFYRGAWQYLQPNLGDLDGNFGPELSFGRTVANALPDANIALIKYSAGGTSLAVDWNPSLPGSMWSGFVNTVSSALSAIDPEVYDPQIVGMVWMQGERDSKFEDMALAYEENLANFIQAVRVQFGVPNLPFVIGQIHSKNTGDFKYVIQQAQFNVWLNVPNTGLVYTDDLTLDDVQLHYDSLGTLLLGERFAAEMLSFPVTVDSIDYVTSTVGKGKNTRDVLSVTVKLTDEMGPVSDALVTVTIIHESGGSWTETASTQGDGTATIILDEAPIGCFITEVIKVDAGVFDWDGTTPSNGFCH